MMETKQKDLLLVEFKVGEEATFKPYEKEIKAKVKEVLQEGHLFSGDVHYHLTGVDRPLTSYTTGRSIKESIYFDNSKFSFAD